MAQSFSLEEALGGASESTSTPAVGFSLEEALGVPAAPEAPAVPGPTPGLVSFINEPKPAPKKFTGSVFDTQPFEPEITPEEAVRLSRRDYAERTTRVPGRVQEAKATPEEQLQRSALRAAGDTVIGLIQGAQAIPKGITDNIPFDNPLSQFYKDAYEAGEKSKSGYLRSKNVERAALLDNIRRNQGELAATRGAFTTLFSPSGADIVAQGAGSLVQAVGMSMLNLGTKSMMAMNALANAGDAAQQTAARLADMSPEDWSKSAAYQSLREQGLDHRDAVRMLAPIYALPSQMIGGITGAVSGGTGLESALVKGGARSARARLGRAGVELVGEEAETLAPMLAGNITQRIIDDRSALLEGLGQAAVETGVAAGPGAGLAAAISGKPREAAAPARVIPEEPAPAAPTEIKPATEPFTLEEALGAPAAPAAPVEAAPVSPAVQRMQEQQRAAAELEAAPEAPAEPTDPQERYKNLTGRMAKITELFRENAITNAEYEDFKRQLEEARQAAQAAPTEGLSEAKQEILRLAGQIEALGQKDFAEGMRLRARPNSPEPRSSDMQYYQQRAAELQFAKAPKEEAAAPETYGLQQFFADDQKEIDRLTQQLAGRGRIKFALQETNDAIQSLHDTIRNAGFTLNQQEVPDGIKKLKNQIGILAAGASRLSKAQEAIDKGYKRADRKRVESDLDQLRSDIDASYELTAVEPKRPTAAEEMEGVEVPPGEEIAGLAEQQRKAAEDRGILSRRTAGTSLMKVLQGTLRDGELSELAGRARQVGKNPFLNLKAPKGQRGSSMEDMVNSGVLDAFLPDAMRPGAETYDNAEAAEYIREKLRNNEFYTYETELAIERIDRDIEAIERQIQELLTIEDINKEIQRAADEQREIDQSTAEPAAEEEVGAAEEGARAEVEEGQIDTPAEEAAPIKDEKVRDKLMSVANNLGVQVFETSEGPVAGEGYVSIPPEDKETEGALTPDHVFAHELGHAIMQKRGMSYNQMSKEQVEKWIPGFASLVEISKAFRPGIWNNKMPKTRRHARKNDEIIADVLGAFLLGDATRDQIKPLLDGVGLSDYDLGLQKFDRRAREDELIKQYTEEEARKKQEREEEAARKEEEARREEERKAAAPKAEEFVLTGSERAADEAAARGQMELAPAEEAKQPDMAYHSGDLNFGRDTVLGRMMGGRSTGHFGTGVYFVGDKSKLKDTFGLRGGRPIQEIDFSKYNLFKPTTDYSAQRLYEALRKINSLVERDIEDQEDFKAAVKKAVTDLAYATGKSEKSILDAIRNHLEEARSLGEKYAFEDKYIPTLATQVMQDLGYEGVDVRGLDRYDNTEHGSVIYAEKINPVEEAKQPDMEAPLSAENEAALPDYLKAAKDGPDAGEYRFRRLVQIATERGTPINVWSTKDGLVTLAEGVEQPKYARLVTVIQPETKERPSNMYKALEQQGFKRLDRNDERVYRDQGGKAYPTFEKNGARIAMTSNNILYENDKGDVEIGYGEPEDTVVHALLVDPATRGQGVASKVMDELGALADEYGVTLYLEPTAISDKPVPTMKLVQFYEGKGYEFDGDSSKVMVRQPGGQTFLNIEPVGWSVAGDESTRSPSLKRKIKTLSKQREQGKISDQKFVEEVDSAVKQDEEQRYKAAARERVRGADFIRQKLLEAKRRGELSAEGVELAEWFIQQNEALVDDLGIAIKTPKQRGTGGQYAAFSRIMALMKNAGDSDTIVHEILHHLERMMPTEMQDAIRKEWMASLLKAQKNAKSPQEKMFFAALMNHHLGSGFVMDIDMAGTEKVLDDLMKRSLIDGPRASSYQLAIDMLRNGIVPIKNYQYATPSEFWAVNGSEIVRGRYNAIKGGLLARLKNWLKELGQKIKSIFGLRSAAPLLRALDSLASSDGKFVTKDMLYQGENFLQVGKNIYGRTPLVAWTKPDETKLDDFIYKMQDKLIDTKRVIQGIEQSIGKIDDKWNPYLQEELFHGRTATETKQFLAGEVRPLLEQMQKEGVTIAELEEYLHNRFAPVRNENIARINPLMPDGGSGIDTADAEAYMAALTPEQKAKYEKLAARVDAITNGTRQYLVASGLEDAETIEEWEKSSPGYVPLNREDVEYSNPVGTGTGRGFSVKGPSSRRATGSERKVVNILSNLISQRESAIVRGEKNRVATALYGLAMQNPNPEYWLAVNPDAAQSRKTVIKELVNMGLSPADAEGIMKEPTQKVVDPQTGMVATRVNSVLRNANNVLGVRINGKDRFVFFNTQNERASRMANALLNLDADQLGTIMSTMAAVTRYFASINTQYNPVFGLYNFLRDLQGGAIQLSNTPIADKRAEVLSPKNLAGALNGIYQTLRTDRKRGQQIMTPWADLWLEFQREGGQTGYRDMFSRSQERAAALQKELNRLSESKGKKAALAAPRWLFDWLADYNETLENAVRLTAYKAALDKGMSKEQAASVAKNLTVNFNRKGQIGVQAGALYAFFNSSVQGTSRLLQTVVRMKRPGDITSLRLTKAGSVIIFGGLLLGVIQAMMMAAMGFDDEEPPDFVKDRNVIIPLPGGKYLAWPLPLGYHVIPAFSRILVEWFLDKGKDPGKRIAHLASLLLDAFSPIGNAGLSVQSIAPTIFDPIVALAENKDWTGKKIAKEDFNKLDPTPGYTRAKQNATWIGKQLSYYLNLASGGDKDKPGVFSPTPDQIDYLIGQATGGVGREVMKAAKSAEAWYTGEELAPYNIPIVGRFYGDTKAGYAESSRFYKNLEEINILENQYKGRQKRQENTADFVKKNPKVRLAEAAHQVERNVQQLRKQRDRLIEKGAPKEQIKAIENRMTLQMKRLNDKAAEMEK